MFTEAIQPPPKTIKEVFKILPEGTLAQLIENNLIMSPSPLFKHQDVLDKIYRRLGNFVEENRLGQTLVAPMDVYLDEENIYQPDILFISKERSDIIKENGIHGAPDLIIEILSPSTADYDRHEKKAVYEKSGVKEYWIVDPETREVKGFSLENGQFKNMEEDKGVISFQSLYLSISF